MKLLTVWKVFKNFFQEKNFFPTNERFGAAVFCAAAAFLIYFYGVVSADFKLFPYGVIQRAYAAFVLVIKNNQGDSSVQTFLFYPERSPNRGLTVNENEYVSQGYTSITYFNDDKLFLLDSDGNTAHVYDPKFSEKERKELGAMFRKHTKSMDKLDFLHILKHHIFKNGDALLMVYGAGARWPLGFGLVKVNRNSDILWKFIDGHTHHDFEISSDGRIFVLSSEVLSNAHKGLEKLPAPYVGNSITILNDQGKFLDRIDLYEAIRDSDYAFLSREANMITVDRYDQRNDHIHANDIDILSAETAKDFKFGNTGDLVVSMRNIHAIGVLDIEAKVFSWLTRGPWIAQHDPDVLPNGNILLYDNVGSDKRGGRTRVMEFDPVTMEVVWSYEGSEKSPFESDIRGSQQRLQNGNTLISEAVGGRVFEVTPQGRIVWEFHSPFRAGPDNTHVPTVRWPKRMPRDYFTIEFLDYLGSKPKGEEVFEQNSVNIE